MNNKRNKKRDNKNSSTSLKEINKGFNDWVGGLMPFNENLEIVLPARQGTKSINTGNANSDADAVFIGWQNTPSGEFFPLYNVTAENHPLYNSTVSVQTLRNENLKIPQTPLPEKP
jgi:hypothetical protein